MEANKKRDMQIIFTLVCLGVLMLFVSYALRASFMDTSNNNAVDTSTTEGNGPTPCKVELNSPELILLGTLTDLGDGTICCCAGVDTNQVCLCSGDLFIPSFEELNVYAQDE